MTKPMIFQEIDDVKTSLADNVQQIFKARVNNKQQITALITFVADDGCVENYTLMKPVLIAKNVPCTSALITGLVGTAGYMTLAQINELKGLGWDFVSHTVNHVHLDQVDSATAETEMKNSQAWLNANGLNGDLLVYPFGGENQSVRKLAKKYYKCGVGITEGYNSTPLYQMQLYRKGIMELTGTQTLNDYKSMVDTAISQNAWLIFKVHPQYTTFSASDLGSLIDYIQSKNVEITTLANAFDRFQNIVDIGDYNYSGNTSNYYVVGVDGIAKSNSIPYSYYVHKYDNGFDVNTPISYFPQGVSVTGLLYADISAKGFPTSGAGVIETHRIDTNPTSDYMAYQLFYQYNTNNVYRRSWNQTGNSWNAWDQNITLSYFNLNQQHRISALNAYTASQLLSAFPNGIITTFPVNSAGATGFPDNVAGICTTYRINNNGFDRQEYRKYNTSELWTRFVDLSGAWTPWMRVGGGQGATTSRPNGLSIGYMWFDTTLSKPVWTKTLGNKEIDTLTISVGATTSGNITITLNGVGQTIAVLAGDSANTIATKIAAVAFSGWTVSTSTNTVTFTKTLPGTNSAPNFADTGVTGATASFAVTTAGTNNTWVDATGTTV